jgi:hypothetical protein
MKANKLKQGLLLLILITTVNIIKAQNRGLTPYKELIKVEGQRYLMENIYQIKKDNFDSLKIDKTIEEIDSDEGFLFVLTSYIFNEKSGVIITSFNNYDGKNELYQFVNVHLTHTEYENLHFRFKDFKTGGLNKNEHILNKYNDRLIVDINNKNGYIHYTLWVDNYSLHSFTTTKWDKAFKRYKKFIEN